MSSSGRAYTLALISSVAIASLLLLLASTGGKGHAEEPGDPVLVGASDVQAQCSTQKDEATAALLANISGEILMLGDGASSITTLGTLQQYQDCYGSSWGVYKDRTHPAVGNHDYDILGASGYFGYFGDAAGDPNQGYYSYDAGSWHVVVLNSNCSQVGGCDAGSPQEQWLEADLAAHPTDCTLAYWHHPRFSSANTLGVKSVAPFWEDLYQAGADVVLSGHHHVYERFAPQNLLAQADPSQGIREFVVGTGGGPFHGFKNTQPNSEVRIAKTYGVLKLTLHPNGYDWEFLKTPNAAVVDSGSSSCHAAPADGTPPVAQPPSQEIPANSTLGASDASTLPVKLSWSATDEQSGVVRYTLEQSTDGGATFASTTSLTSLNTTRQLQPDGTYQFRVKATDGAGNRNEWAAAPPFVVDPEQEASDAITYAGSWTQETSDSAYGGGMNWSATKNSTAQFAFSGSNVAWVTTKRPNGGRARISIDGAVIKTVDLYASTSQPRKVVFSQAGLDPTVGHTISVQVLGTKGTASSGTRVDVDAFVALH